MKTTNMTNNRINKTFLSFLTIAGAVVVASLLSLNFAFADTVTYQNTTQVQSWSNTSSGWVPTGNWQNSFGGPSYYAKNITFTSSSDSLKVEIETGFKPPSDVPAGDFGFSIASSTGFDYGVAFTNHDGFVEGGIYAVNAWKDPIENGSTVESYGSPSNSHITQAQIKQGTLIGQTIVTRVDLTNGDSLFSFDISLPAIVNASSFGYIWAVALCGNGVISGTATVPPPLTGSCAVTPLSGIIGDSFNYSTNASGGTGVYSYSWSGDEGLSGLLASIIKSYTTIGTKNATVVITSGSQSITKNCSVIVSAVPPPPPPPPVPLTGVCSVSPSVANIGDIITWLATASGGTGTYSYSWSGTDILSSTTTSVTKTYATAGAKIGNVTITSGSDTVSAEPCSVNIKPPTVGCTFDCGGGFNPPNVVLTSTTTPPAPRIATLTTMSPYSIYLSQIPYTGFGDQTRLILFIVLTGLWSAVAVYVIKFIKIGDIKNLVKRTFGSAENEPQIATAEASGDLISDFNDERVLILDMSPSPVKMTEIYTPTAQDYGIVKEPNNAPTSYQSNVSPASPKDSGQKTNTSVTTEINAFVNLIAQGEEKPILEFVRKIKDRGGAASDFAANVVLELDNAYRSRLAEETNVRNLGLSQIIARWSNPKIESVMNGLFALVENSYTDNNLGTKIALMRIMRTA